VRILAHLHQQLLCKSVDHYFLFWVLELVVELLYIARIVDLTKSKDGGFLSICRGGQESPCGVPAQTVQGLCCRHFVLLLLFVVGFLSRIFKKLKIGVFG